MPDYLADNPYMQGFAPTDEDRRARLFSTIANTLVGLGAGISQSGASGQPWFAGVGPGAAMGVSMNAHAQQQDELERMRRFQMGLHMQALRDKEEERRLKREGLAAWTPGGQTAATPGITAPDPPLMGPDARTASLEGGTRNGGMVFNELGSGAFGPYQFMPQTWAVVRAQNPSLNLPEDITTATRAQHDAAHGAFKAGNAQALQAAGIPPTPDNLYLAHRFGAGGAASVVKADPDTLLADVLPIDWQRQNPDMRGQTAGGFRRLATERMAGGSLPYEVRPDARPIQYGGPVIEQGDSTQDGTQPPAALTPVMPQPKWETPGDIMPVNPAAWFAPPPPAPVPGTPQGGDPATPVQYKPPSQGPAPQMAPPPEPPQVPKPSLSPDEIRYLNGLKATGQMTVPQLAAEEHRLINEKWTRLQGAADKKWTQQREDYRFNRGEANKLDTYRPMTEAEKREAGLPENVQFQVNTKTNKVEPMTNTKQPRFEDVKDSTGKVIGQRNVDTNQYHPINQNTSADFAVPKDLKGEDVYQALVDAGQVGKANEIKSIVEGDSPIPSANARTAGAQATRDLVFQMAGPEFTDALHAERLKMKTEMNKGKIGTALRAQGTLFNHLDHALDIAKDLNNSPYPLANRAANALGMGSGDPRVTEMQVTKTRINGELEKYFTGGVPTVSGLQEARDELNAAQSPAQINAAVRTITKLVAGQQSEYLNQINRGLGYLGTDKAIGPDDPRIITLEAQQARQRVIDRTVPQKADYSKTMDTIKEATGAKSQDMQPKSGDPLEGRTATGPNGQKVIRRNGQWVPL